MVLEHLFPEDWLEKKHRYAFLLAIVYSTIGIVVARLLFPANSGIVSVAITSLLLIPYLNKLLEKEEKKELKEKRLTLKHFWLDNKQAILVYGTIFLGVYATYLAYSFVLPMFGFDTGSVFREQLALETNLRGNAFQMETFLNIFLNNWWVLLACFLLALVAGDGALFFIIWNASSWGTIFGFRALEAAVHGGAYGPLANLAIIVAITFPHLALEGGAYILAAISGGVLSDDIVSKRSAMSRFIYYFLASGIIFIVLFFLYRTIFTSFPLVASILNIVTVLVLLHFLSFVFDDKRHMEVFRYNYYLFVAAILIFLIGAFVETVVIGNSTLLQVVYMASLGF
ncbi:hypothetical protein GOV07_00355 [Candidatus Woesearchaeota archaeon]|nr:hypothetical protein [Candidatus Woesearchaeota archaeon]